jgi:hypothetical protein
MRFPLAREWNAGNILSSGGLKCLQTANTTSRRWYNNAHYSIPFGISFFFFFPICRFASLRGTKQSREIPAGAGMECR